MSGVDAVIVTGAGHGLGRAVAERCAIDGISVLCVSRTSAASATQQTILDKGGRADSIVVDLADLEETGRLVSQWLDKVSYHRLAVVCAAGTLGRAGGILEADLADWARTFQVNVLGNLAVVRALLPRMIQTAFGRIITVAGGGAAYAYPLFSGYALSKVAMVRATENLELELRGKGDFLTVCLAPGAMDTRMLADVRAAGAEVRTMVDIAEPVEFIAQFLRAQSCAFSGRFVHVRDDWRECIKPATVPGERWLLRRVESCGPRLRAHRYGARECSRPAAG
jgi:NAD(P)-dependent dehydrogenase (short-subunit alcohol dehydrogenase family)